MSQLVELRGPHTTPGKCRGADTTSAFRRDGLSKTIFPLCEETPRPTVVGSVTSKSSRIQTCRGSNLWSGKERRIAESMGPDLDARAKRDKGVSTFEHTLGNEFVGIRVF